MSILTEKITSASVIQCIQLTTAPSTRKTCHLTLDISTCNFSYKPGDAIAIFPKNDPSIVEQIIQLGAFSKNAQVQDRKGNVFSFENYLLEKVDLQRASHKLIQFVCHHAYGETKEVLEKFTHQDLVSVLELMQRCDFYELQEQDFVALLKPLTPRFYSIASASMQNEKQIDLLVTLSKYRSVFANTILGTCTDYLCNRIKVGESLSIYLHPTKHFTLPKEPKPLIMIGPGTGVAPFRGFLQQRVLEKQTDNWLFFGERNEKTDFYYQQEFLRWKEQRYLKLHTAFSRDQEQKIYVQHRLQEASEEIWQWVENEAIIYVCGDAQQMAKAVQETFIHIFDQYAKGSSGMLFFKQLRKEGRYLFDVY